VANGFALLQLSALNLERAVLAAEGTRSSAFGTRLLLTQGVGLLFKQGLQGALGEPSGGGVGDLLHGIEIDIESGPIVVKGASGNDFAPPSGEAAEFMQFLRCKGTACHNASCVEVKSRKRERVVPVRIRPRT
jgi:hypothetical protein